ncbi:unnamed protein product [Oikopleura dioica]|uniref:Uncharacterized protein n=1 Tax=Oikopleura dioica TaxID=34765 RepID=E4XEH9_OIKDI|nr:unnamed protein product [Oikopleura dioica]
MLNFQTFLASALTAVVALITVSTDTKKIENRAAETEEKQRRFEVNRKIREEEEYRKKEHDKKMMDFGKQRIELEKAAKSADLKNKEHKQQV